MKNAARVNDRANYKAGGHQGFNQLADFQVISALIPSFAVQLGCSRSESPGVPPGFETE